MCCDAFRYLTCIFFCTLTPVKSTILIKFKLIYLLPLLNMQLGFLQGLWSPFYFNWNRNHIFGNHQHNKFWWNLLMYAIFLAKSLLSLKIFLIYKKKVNKNKYFLVLILNKALTFFLSIKYSFIKNITPLVFGI